MGPLFKYSDDAKNVFVVACVEAQSFALQKIVSLPSIRLQCFAQRFSLRFSLNKER
jgi:hypothetical protein